MMDVARDAGGWKRVLQGLRRLRLPATLLSEAGTKLMDALFLFEYSPADHIARDDKRTAHKLI